MWLWLLANRKLIGYAAIAAAAAAVVLHFRSDWIEKGKQQASATQTADEKKTWEGERATLKALVDRANDRDDALLDRLKEFEATTARLAALAASSQARADALSRAAAAVPSTVATVADADLAATVRNELGVRAPGDATPGFTAPELRAILTDVRQVPVLTGEVVELRATVSSTTKQVESLSGSVATLEDRVRTAQEKTVAYASYATSLEAHYATAFNALPRRRSFVQHLCGIVTFYLACKPARVVLPSPVEVEAKRP